MCDLSGKCKELGNIPYSMTGKQIGSYQTKKVTHYLCKSCLDLVQSGTIFPRFPFMGFRKVNRLPKFSPLFYRIVSNKVKGEVVEFIEFVCW